MPRLDQDKQKQLEPKRMEYAKTKLRDLGLSIDLETDVSLKFKWKDADILLFPYSGWHTGKTIVDGILYGFL